MGKQVEQGGGWDAISKCSGCDVSFGNLSKSICYEIGEPCFVGCVHVWVQDFAGEWANYVKYFFMSIVTRTVCSEVGSR